MHILEVKTAKIKIMLDLQTYLIWWLLYFHDTFLSYISSFIEVLIVLIEMYVRVCLYWYEKRNFILIACIFAKGYNY